MKCENCFCVYEYDGSCLLEHIELDIQGQCKECVYINIEDTALTTAKTRLLQSLGEGFARKERITK